MSDSHSAPADFRVGRVLGRSFELMFGDFIKFFAVNLILWLPFVVLGVVAGLYLAANMGNPQNINFVAVFVGAIIAIILILVLSLLSQAVTLVGAFQKMRGQGFSIGASLARGLSRVGAILIMAFVMGLAIFFGLFLLIVPGLIFVTMWFVALPACVLERLGPLASLERSAALTRGYRWKVFGIALVTIVTAGVTVAVRNAAFGPFGYEMQVILDFVLNVVLGAIYGVIVAVLYHELRVAKEGVDSDPIAAAFD